MSLTFIYLFAREQRNPSQEKNYAFGLFVVGCVIKPQVHTKVYLTVVIFVNSCIQTLSITERVINIQVNFDQDLSTRAVKGPDQAGCCPYPLNLPSIYDSWG